MLTHAWLSPISRSFNLFVEELQFVQATMRTALLSHRGSAHFGHTSLESTRPAPLHCVSTFRHSMLLNNRSHGAKYRLHVHYAAMRCRRLFCAGVWCHADGRGRGAPGRDARRVPGPPRRAVGRRVHPRAARRGLPSFELQQPICGSMEQEFRPSGILDGHAPCFGVSSFATDKQATVFSSWLFELMPQITPSS